MTNEQNNILRLYYVPQFFPCGPNSSCCGPSGQSDEEVQNYVSELESNVAGLKVETIDAGTQTLREHEPAVEKLLSSFGPAACPIFTLDGEALSMGPPNMEELIAMVNARFTTGQPQARSEQ